MNLDFTPFLSGFNSYFEIFASLCTAFALWEPFRIGFEKVITTEDDITEVKEMLLKLTILNQDIENELQKSSSNDSENSIITEISKVSVNKFKEELNDVILIQVPTVISGYEELEETIKNRGKITEASFLLTAIYCFSLIVLSGIEAYYMWKIVKIERMVYFFSFFNLLGVAYSFYKPDSIISYVNSISIIIFPVAYLFIAILILFSFNHIGYLELSNHQLNACINVGIILIVPLVPFILHIWITPIMFDNKRKLVDVKYNNIIEQLPDPIKKRLEMAQPPI